MKSFLDHYRSMGVKHFVFLDNGSTDRTVELLYAQEQVTVLQTDAPYNKYEKTMKEILGQRRLGSSEKYGFYDISSIDKEIPLLAPLKSRYKDALGAEYTSGCWAQ